MVFSIVSIAQDVLQDFLRVMEEEKVKRENEAEQEKLKADEAKYKGTPVTMETFSAWRQQFFIEMDKQNGKLKETGNQSKGLTGGLMYLWKHYLFKLFLSLSLSLSLILQCTECR